MGGGLPPHFAFDASGQIVMIVSHMGHLALTAQGSLESYLYLQIRFFQVLLYFRTGDRILYICKIRGQWAVLNLF